MASKVEQMVERLITPHADAMDLEIVAVELRKQDNQRFMRVFIAKPDGERMDWETCERFHRSIVDLLEEVDYDYLEVSSPGDRPLKTPRDFQRNLNHDVDIKLYAPLQGSKQFSGLLTGYDAQGLTIEMDGQQIFLPMKSVAQVKPAFRIE